MLIVLDRIGGTFFSFILAAMKGCLKEGFDKHVLNYTLYDLLEIIKSKNHRIDYCIDQVIELILDEIYGLLE